MTKYYHNTNNLNSNTPSSSDIDVGEVCVNSTSLGNITDGVQSGRLYIKLSNGEIRRFVIEVANKIIGTKGADSITVLKSYVSQNPKFVEELQNLVKRKEEQEE